MTIYVAVVLLVWRQHLKLCNCPIGQSAYFGEAAERCGYNHARKSRALLIYWLYLHKLKPAESRGVTGTYHHKNVFPDALQG